MIRQFVSIIRHQRCFSESCKIFGTHQKHHSSQFLPHYRKTIDRLTGRPKQRQGESHQRSAHDNSLGTFYLGAQAAGGD